MPAQVYENFISDLVSHGYIVIGINSPFINLVELPNRHVVEPASINIKDLEKYVQLQLSDLDFVYQKITQNHDNDSILNYIDLAKIGAFGHSIGGLTIAKFAHEKPEFLRAVVSFDIGRDNTGLSRKPFVIPFMHQIASTRKDVEVPAPQFELDVDNYVVGISPDIDNRSYSTHTSFTDISTLQDAPAFIELRNHLQERLEGGFDLKIITHKPTSTDIQKYKNITYVLYRENTEWKGNTYEEQKLEASIAINWVAGLKQALDTLPDKEPEDLTTKEIEPVLKSIEAMHRTVNQFIGDGDGWEVTYSINTNLLEFFNTYLKGKINPNFKNCIELTHNTYIKCGPGKY